MNGIRQYIIESTSKYYYHVAPTQVKNKILTQGIVPSFKYKNWDKTDIGYLYIINNLASAIRWISHTEWELKKPVSLFLLKNIDKSTLEDDPKSFMERGHWHRTDTAIPRNKIAGVIDIGKIPTSERGIFGEIANLAFKTGMKLSRMKEKLYLKKLWKLAK